MSDVLGAADSPAGATAEWKFSAPAGTTIVGADLYRYIGKEASNNWTVYGRLADGSVFDTCSFNPATEPGCFAGYPGGSGGAKLELRSVSTSSISYGVRCDATNGEVCGTGATLHHVWAVVYGARVTLRDNSIPRLATAAFPNTDRWLRGAIQIPITADDNSGIQATAVAEGGRVLSNRTRPCSFDQPIPCTNEPGTVHEIASAQLTDGPHSLQATATDAAGNVGRGEPRTVLIDNNAPTAPQGLAVAGGEKWHRANGFDVSWAIPDQAPGSPVAKIHYRLCDQAATCEPEQIAEGAQTSLKSLLVPRMGDWTLRVWLEDVAGNVSETNAAAAHLKWGVNVLAPSVVGKARPALRIGTVRRRASRLVVRGRVRKGTRGRVVITVRRAKAKRPRATRRVKLKKARYVARIPLPDALRAAGKLRVTVTYGGDALHRRARVVRIVRGSHRS